MNKDAKILVLGMDGMDPRMSKCFMEEGIMPNLSEFVKRGPNREDISFLGATPTVTPPIWTTLATGAYANTHGITCFWRQNPQKLDELIYSFDSGSCKAEQFWNVFAEAGFKTLVWHWPGSSWPPSSDNPNLNVVDGTQPSAINLGVALVDWENILLASEEFEVVSFKAGQGSDTGAGCIIKDVGIHENTAEENIYSQTSKTTCKLNNIITDPSLGEASCETAAFDVTNSPIKIASGWSIELPNDAKEFILLSSGGLVRRNCLILKNDKGVYDHIAVYKNKKALEPLFELTVGAMEYNFVDEAIIDGNKGYTNRNYKLLEVAEDGSKVRMWLSAALNTNEDMLFHPKSLLEDIKRNVAPVPPAAFSGTRLPEIIDGALLPSWSYYVEWQGKTLNYLIKEKGYQIIYSHLHNIDICGHIFWTFAKKRSRLDVDEKVYQDFIRQAYIDADKYLGQFLHLLDEDWTIFIVADHGLNISEDDHPAELGDVVGVNGMEMVDMGYTVLKKDENGNPLREIDWSKTRAIASRGNHIWINLKGRWDTGIVDPTDKYELEEQIISDLYSYRKDGRRVVACAVRNKDAKVFNLSGEECGDIIYFVNEKCSKIHADILSTAEGYFDSSVAPIFVCAGAGLKKGGTLERVIRQADLSPTMAILAGVRMAKQCEGAPIYQIFENN